MRVRSLRLDEAPFNDGLGRVEMRRLGPIVVLTGPNGAGKSRLLSRVEKLHNLARTRTQIDQIRTQVQTLAARLDAEEHAQIRTKLEGTRRRLEAAEGIAFEPDGNQIRSVRFVPGPATLRDPRAVPPSGLDAALTGARSLGVATLSQNVALVVQAVQQRAIELTHPVMGATDEAAERAQEDYDRLREYVRRFLGTSIERSESGYATLFGRAIHEASVSQGQSVLLQVAVALWAQGGALRDCLLLLDEPENHLHPSALRDFMDGIADASEECQTWIATHSIHILARVTEESIWFVDEGKVSRGGRTPERVLTRLIGDGLEQQRLVDFLDMPQRVASIRFAAGCLVTPKAVETGVDDPQLNQVRELLSKRIEGRQRLRVLDFAAGKGRLLPALAELCAVLDLDLRALDYYALEPDSDSARDLAGVIGQHYGAEEVRSRLLTSSEDLTRLDAGSVDVVVLINALHEIAPSAWPGLFATDLGRILAPQGELLLVEDYDLPHGESAHAFGFLLLDEPELRALFAVEEADRFAPPLSERSGRLKAHRISANAVRRVTAETRRAAIQHLQRRAKREIQRIRDGSQDLHETYKAGRQHALWLTLFANASLALADDI